MKNNSNNINENNVSKNGSKKEKVVFRKIIPNHIIDLSRQIDDKLLAMFIYLKRRVAEDGVLYLNFKSMVDNLYGKNQWKKVKEVSVKSFILILTEIHSSINDEVSYSNCFEIDTINLPLSKMINSIKVYFNEVEHMVTYESKNKKIKIDELIENIGNYLEENEVRLVDLSRDNMTKFIALENDLIDYLEKYSIIQNSNETVLGMKNELLPNIQTDLEMMKTKLNIYSGNPELSPLVNNSYLLLVYCYIFKLWTLNTNLGNSTYVSVSTMSEQLNLSKKQIMHCTNILENIGLIETTKSNFKAHKTKEFFISTKWKDMWKSNSTVYKFSIISKEDRDKILTTYYTTKEVPVKRGRGRPRKNNI